MVIDVTDATFETEVLARSETVPVVVDLWAEWCGPCRTLGPILERVVEDTDGRVVLAKVDTDTNPETAAAFRVQGIPAVYAVLGRSVVDSFVGAQPEHEVRRFVDALVPSDEQLRVAELVAAGDEASLRAAVELAPGDETAVVALAEHLVGAGQVDEALELLARLPASPATRRVAALARLGVPADGAPDAAVVEARLEALLAVVKGDDGARTEFLDLLELLGPADERTTSWRRRLTTALY
jgi:putative thioredoxin